MMRSYPCGSRLVSSLQAQNLSHVNPQPTAQLPEYIHPYIIAMLHGVDCGSGDAAEVRKINRLDAPDAAKLPEFLVQEGLLSSARAPFTATKAFNH